MLTPDSPESSNRELTTWSEIARYLGVTERTAQTWRKERGLPVGRVGGRVVASTADLDRWKAATNDSSRPEELPQPAALPPRRRVWAVTSATIVTAACLGIWLWFNSTTRPPTRIVRHELHGNVLVVFDEDGKRAWSHPFDFALEDMPDERSSRSRLADIDGDGQPELLFVAWPQGNRQTLYCFRNDGRVAWSRQIGRAITDRRGRQVLPQYWSMRLIVLKKPRSDGGRILVLAHHAFSWPSVVEALTPAGALTAEYWHPGWLEDMSAADLNNDGADELILSGINNSFEEKGDGATLVLLKSDFKTGQGPLLAGDPREVGDIPPGEQVAVLLFPETPKLSESTTAAMVKGAVWLDGHLDVNVRGAHHAETVHYQLDSRLRLLNVTPSGVLLEAIAPGASPDQRRKIALKRFGRITVVKNDLDRQ